MAERPAATTPWSALPRLSMPELWAVLAVLLPVLGSLIASISTVDLAYHVRAGELILDTGLLPSPDTFTFTAGGQPWLDQQWAAQAVFGAIFRLGGWALLATVRAALVGLIAWLVFRACRSSGAGTRVAAWLTLAGFAVGLVALGLRPQLLGMALFAATLAILAARERRPSLVWAIPLIVLAWANVHGSFFLGPAAVVVAWLDDVVNRRAGARRLLAVAIVSTGATFLNPYGVGVWSYGLGLAANPTIRRLITEWQATSPLSFAGAMFYGSIAGLIAIVGLSLRPVVRSGRSARYLRSAWPTLLWLLALAAIGGFAERGVAWWSIGAPVALAGLLRIAAEVSAASGSSGDSAARLVEGTAPASEPTARPVPERSLVPTAIVAILVLAIVALLPIWRGGSALYGPAGLLTDAPAGLTEAVLREARPGDRIWNAQRWGSWLEFAVPAAQVAVDSRIELIPTDAWADHLALSSGAPDWAAILERRGVTIVVASATEQRGLIPSIRASGAWRQVADDADGAVFVRADR